MTEPSYTRDVGRPRPGPGSSPRKVKPWVLYAGGGLVVVGVYVFVVRRKAAASTAAATPTDTSSTDTSGYDPNAYVDPGYSAADSYGGYSGAGYPSVGGYYDQYGNLITQGVPQGSVVTAPSTNPQWFQQSVGFLVNEGYNPLSVTDALGKYLATVGQTAGASVTPNENSIIQAAIGAEGYPPDRPPNPKLQTPNGQTPQTEYVNTTKAMTFRALATFYHMTDVQLVRLNPILAARYNNTGKNVPVGTRIRIYKPV